MRYKKEWQQIRNEDGDYIDSFEIEVPWTDSDYQNYHLQLVALEEYLGRTKPLEWNYPGWLAYWRSKGLYRYMYIELEDFNSIIEKYRPPLIAASEQHKQAHDEPSRGRNDEAEESLERAKEAFKKKVEESDWYNTCPSIRKPFFWLGSIRELALALSEETGLLDIRINNNREEVYIADVADCLFKKSTGEPITHEQLYNAAKQARDEDNKIKFTVPKKPRSK